MIIGIAVIAAIVLLAFWLIGTYNAFVRSEERRVGKEC